MSKKIAVRKEPLSASAKKFVALFDIHVGWEWARSAGKMIVRPTHNEPAIKATLEFVKDFAPDVLIFGGDSINCGPVSHWLKGKPRLVEGFRLKNELDKFADLFSEVALNADKTVFMIGNHEAWIDQMVDENPGLEGMIEPQAYLEELWNETVSQGEMYRLTSGNVKSKLYFVHGDSVLQARQYRSPARALVEAYGRNIRAGHVHTYDVYTKKSPIDKQDYHSGIIVPALASRDPYYVKSAPSNFMHGFEYGWFWPDGEFTDQIVVINNSTFTINGKRYGKEK